MLKIINSLLSNNNSFLVSISKSYPGDLFSRTSSGNDYIGRGHPDTDPERTIHVNLGLWENDPGKGRKAWIFYKPISTVNNERFFPLTS